MESTAGNINRMKATGDQVSGGPEVLKRKVRNAIRGHKQETLGMSIKVQKEGEPVKYNLVFL